MYIDDCIEGTIRLMASAVADPINVGFSKVVTINQLVDIVERIAGVKLRRYCKLAAPLGVSGRSSDNTRILERLGWEPSTRLEDGLEKTYRWIYDQSISQSSAMRIDTRTYLYRRASLITRMNHQRLATVRPPRRRQHL
jgi:GDP-D-mannose 3', 5'-epimerase